MLDYIYHIRITSKSHFFRKKVMILSLCEVKYVVDKRDTALF